MPYNIEIDCENTVQKDNNYKEKIQHKMASIIQNKLLFIILLIKSLLFADALKCYQCGQYNDGVGSITPCLNYTEKTAAFYIKDCPRSSDAYCIVSWNITYSFPVLLHALCEATSSIF